MENKILLLSLQKGLVKELCLQGLITEEQTKIAMAEFEQIYESNLLRELKRKDLK